MNRSCIIIASTTAVYSNILLLLFWHHLICVPPTASGMTVTSLAASSNLLDKDKNDDKCDSVHCLRVDDCPPDSYKLSTNLNSSGEVCQCLPNCEPLQCPSDANATIELEPTGKPGRCCALYKCQKLDQHNSSIPVANTTMAEEPRPELIPESAEINENIDLNLESIAGCEAGQHGLVKHGSNWTSQDSCGTCTCNDGKVSCVTAACQPCIESVFLSDQCCPVCKVPHIQPEHCPPMPNCTDLCENGNQLDENGCVTCECRPGNWHENTHSTRTDIVEGALSCKTEDNGMMRNAGKLWLDGHRRQCVCISGEEMCSLILCPALDCTNPVYNLSLSSCPICPKKPIIGKQEYDYVPCSSTKNMSTIPNDFVQCVCHNNYTLCHAKRCPPTPCPRPSSPTNDFYCPTCPVLTDNAISIPSSEEQRTSFEKYDERCLEESTRDLPWREGSCISCRCEEDLTHSKVNDTQLPYLPRFLARCYTESCNIQSLNSCRRPLVIKGRCCAICLDAIFLLNLDLDVNNYSIKYNMDQKYCLHNNVIYTSGSEWNKDGCTKCKCQNGTIQCLERMCSEVCSKSGNTLCCSSCTSGDKMVADWNALNTHLLIYVVSVIFIIFALIITVYCSRHFRYQKQQIRLHDFKRPSSQYKYVPTSPYDIVCPTEKV